MAENFDIRRVRNVLDADIQSLVEQSDAYLSTLYPPESNHAEPLDVLTADDAAFFGVYNAGRAVACGAVKLVEKDERYGEIKRVFVDPSQRGKGLAIKIMAHLETFLGEQGIDLVRLEAGPKQPEAIGLYRKLGYVERGPFGHYRDDPLSVFMEKRLTDA